MPSPAIQKLETLPLTPLQSGPNSPASSSRPSSRRGSANIASSSSSIQQFRKQSHGGHNAMRPNLGSLSVTPVTPVTAAGGNGSGSNSASADRRSPVSAPSAGTSSSALLAGLSSIQGSPSGTNANLNNGDQQGSASSNVTPANQQQIHQAVDEEQMLHSSTQHAESAIDDDDETDDDEEVNEDETADVDGTLRTGNTRFRSGSRRLSRLSSTLGEGITAHWKRSNPASAEPKSPSEPSQSAQPQKIAAAIPIPTSGLRNVVQSSSPARSAPISGSPLPPSAGLPDVHLEQAQAAKAALTLSPIEKAKRLAAYRAVDVHVKPHHRVIGIGSGSTVPYVVDRLLEQGDEANKKRWFVPTGFQSKELIVNAGLKLGDVDQFPVIDVTIDGADDVDWALNAIKGGGACHLREKVLAEAAEEFVMVADYRKNNMILGQTWKQGIPIETPPFAYSKVFDNLERIPGCMVAQLRMGQAKAGPVDNGNFVIDAPFDEAHMREPESLLVKIKMLTGVVEVGLFCGMAKAAYFGNADGSVTVRWSDGQQETLKDGEEAKITADMIDENYRPTDLLLTYQLPQLTQESPKADGLEANKLQQKLEQLRMTST